MLKKTVKNFFSNLGDHTSSLKHVSSLFTRTHYLFRASNIIGALRTYHKTVYSFSNIVVSQFQSSQVLLHPPHQRYQFQVHVWITTKNLYLSFTLINASKTLPWDPREGLQTHIIVTSIKHVQIHGIICSRSNLCPPSMCCCC